MPTFSPLYNQSPRGSLHGSTQLRTGGRAGASTPNRVHRLDYADRDPHGASSTHFSTPTHGSLHPAGLISPDGFARPSCVVGSGSASRGGRKNKHNDNNNNGSSGAALSPTRAVRRKGSPSWRSGRFNGLSPSTPSRRRSGRSATTSPAVAEIDERHFALFPPPPSGLHGYNCSSVTDGGYHDSDNLRHRNPLHGEEDEGRCAVSSTGSSLEAGANGGGGAGCAGLLCNSVLHSTLSSSASGCGCNGNGGGDNTILITNNAGSMSFSPTCPRISLGLNPLRRISVPLESPIDTSVSVSGGAVRAVASTSLGNLPPSGPLKEHCCHCKVENEALYLCPCGLARYCSTTCQWAHWSVHRRVCCSGVRVMTPSWRRCDWCGFSSQSLRRCGCGFAYYCDVHCQRADWSFHRLVCSTVASEAIVAALLGGPAPRTTHEAATQTAHWQINVPVLRSLARNDAETGAAITPPADSRGGVCGFASTSFPTSSQPYNFTSSDSFGEARSFDGNSTANDSSFQRSNCTQSRPWEHNSQFPGDSFYTKATLTNSRSALAANTGYAGTARQHTDPARRPSRSCAGGSVSPRSLSCRYPQPHHHRHSSVYESLYLTINSQGPPSPPNMHFRSETEVSPMVSKMMGHCSVSFVKMPTLNGATIGSGNRHSHAASELEGGPENTGTASNGGVSPSSSITPVRDQPSLLAFAATSQRKIESDEHKEWVELYRQFQMKRVSIELKVLPKLEEEQRIAILKEEMMWCVVTGRRAAKELRQRVLGKTKR